MRESMARKASQAMNGIYFGVMAGCNQFFGFIRGNINSVFKNNLNCFKYNGKNVESKLI